VPNPVPPPACPSGQTSLPGGGCCPSSQVTSQGICCPAGEISAPGGGSCCPPGPDGTCHYNPPAETPVPAVVPEVPGPSNNPEQCANGLMTRDAFRGDRVCVTRAVHDQTISDNVAAPSRIKPNGTCVQGYVWREANPTDHVCVLPTTRAQTWSDNRRACPIGQSRQADGSCGAAPGCVGAYVMGANGMCVHMSPSNFGTTCAGRLLDGKCMLGNQPVIKHKPSRERPSFVRPRPTRSRPSFIRARPIRSRPSFGRPPRLNFFRRGR
jgi:hypothetical protein